MENFENIDERLFGNLDKVPSNKTSKVVTKLVLLREKSKVVYPMLFGQNVPVKATHRLKTVHEEAGSKYLYSWIEEEDEEYAQSLMDEVYQAVYDNLETYSDSNPEIRALKQFHKEYILPYVLDKDLWSFKDSAFILCIIYAIQEPYEEIYNRFQAYLSRGIQKSVVGYVYNRRMNINTPFKDMPNPVAMAGALRV